ncbi:MAG: chemotaxis protein CheC, partial [Ignavibacteria bacterium]|nr:chemotaxis protein CheC [Ignavibacteria bacterium]
MNLSENQIDLIRETINIGVGRSAAILNKMINKHIKLQVPYVAFAELEKIKELFSPTPDEELSSVNLNFKGSLVGAAK